MKKLLAISLAVIMVFCMGFGVFATPGEFVESPSHNKAPTLVSGTSQSEDCMAELIITAFIYRMDLPEELRILIEKAYKDIANCKNLVYLCSALADIAKALNIPEVCLAVSDLFDIRFEGCDDHGEHGMFDIVISSDTFKNFVALMHLSDDGWEIIDNATVKEVDGEYHLYFSTDDFSPFAVVVNSSVVVDKNPNTGDDYNIYIYAAIMLVSAFVALTALKKKKQTA